MAGGTINGSTTSGVMLIVIVFVALSFDLLWHKIIHSLHHAYTFGRRRHHEDHEERTHKNLALSLAHRAGAEFMTLGFLAFLIFVCSQTGAFEALAELSEHTGCEEHHEHTLKLGDGDDLWLACPCSGEDWLHLAELVHMRLFIGMVFYFTIIACILRRSVLKIRQWEVTDARLAQRQRTPQAARMATAKLMKQDTDLHDLQRWHRYFISRVASWRNTRPAVFRELLSSLGLTLDQHESVAETLEAVNFFGSYLAFSVEDGVYDSIEFHPSCWVALMLIYAVFGIINAFAHVRTAWLSIVAATFLLLAMVAMWRKVDSSLAAIGQGPEVVEPERADWTTSPVRQAGLDEKTNTERIVLRSLDVAIFILTGFLSALLLGMDASWENSFRLAIAETSGILLVCVLFAAVLQHIVPLYLAIMALPPHVDEDNLATLKYVISQSFMNHSKSKQECESVLCAETGKMPSNKVTTSMNEESRVAMQATLLANDGD
jgi:hypothetical protein